MKRTQLIFLRNKRVFYDKLKCLELATGSCIKSFGDPLTSLEASLKDGLLLKAQNVSLGKLIMIHRI
jgi:hypothetical protein